MGGLNGSATKKKRQPLQSTKGPHWKMVTSKALISSCCTEWIKKTGDRERSIPTLFISIHITGLPIQVTGSDLLLHTDWKHTLILDTPHMKN